MDLSQLSQAQVQEVYTRLAQDGRTICGVCKKVFKLRKCIALAYRGNIMLAVCPGCLPQKALCVRASGNDIAVGLVDPKILEAADRKISIAPANVRLPPLASVLGPRVERKDY
jgi:hypothetical protein